MRKRGGSAPSLQSVGSPLGGDQTVSSAVAAPLPTFPITTTVSVRAGDILQVSVVFMGNASSGATAILAQLYVGGVAQRSYKAVSAASNYGFCLSWTEDYTVLADDAALAVEVYGWRSGLNYLLTSLSGMQIMRFPA